MELIDKLKTLTKLGVSIILDDSLENVTSWSTGSIAFLFPKPAPKPPNYTLSIGTIWHPSYIEHVVDNKIEEIEYYENYKKQIKVNSETIKLIEDYLKTI